MEDRILAHERGLPDGCLDQAHPVNPTTKRGWEAADRFVVRHDADPIEFRLSKAGALVGQTFAQAVDGMVTTVNVVLRAMARDMAALPPHPPSRVARLRHFAWETWYALDTARRDLFQAIRDDLGWVLLAVAFGLSFGAFVATLPGGGLTGR